VLGHEDETRASSLALGGLLTEVRAQEERRAALVRDLERMTRELEELTERSERGLEAGRRALADAGEARQRAAEREIDLAHTREARAAAAAEAAAGEARLAQDGAAVRDAEARLDAVLQELEEARARREQRAVEFERSRLELEHLVETCREELGVPPGALSTEAPLLEGLEMLDDDAALAGRIADARGRRERVGPVNPLAEQEYEELSTRYEQQSSQKDDLEATIAELNNSIKKMDRESKERFSEAFVEIRRHFREQFALLFRGGKADLLLEDESNPLESGVEIVCQPPGKKLQSVTLLSGGEKALAATAVLFAIFRYAPPPFCLLDEVDAPLDDANVGRFADALRGFADRTQFIVITHNKRSMEMADLLYGVTMAEPGVSRLVSMTLD
jgi:chromosome segregation protein